MYEKNYAQVRSQVRYFAEIIGSHRKSSELTNCFLITFVFMSFDGFSMFKSWWSYKHKPFCPWQQGFFVSGCRSCPGRHEEKNPEDPRQRIRVCI